MRKETIGNAELYLGDCMELMADLPDDAFDLAIVDPPYGINFGKFNRTNALPSGERVKANAYKQGNWDSEIPNDDYHHSLRRVSNEQIVWGGNYFPSLWQNGCKGFIFWWKHQPVSNFSDGELAWTSFNKPAKCFDFSYFGALEGEMKAEKRTHPTQKPVKLYEWLLTNYAEKGQSILDTHLGSGSSAIAANNMGFKFTGIEIDEDYFNAACERIEQAQKQVRLFD